MPSVKTTSRRTTPHGRVRNLSAVLFSSWLVFSVTALAQDQKMPLPAAVDATGAPSDVVPVEVYTGPKRISVQAPKYPRAAQRRDEEGWVRVNFMVDTEGKPYEISASDHAGDSEFVDAAIDAVRRWRFEPAHLDGVPLDAGAAFKITFALESGPNGAARSFVSRYRRLVAAIEKEDQAKAEELLQALQVKNLYEDAYSNVARFLHAEKWGSKRMQRIALERAIAYEDDARYLPAATYTWALQRLVILQVEAGQPVKALQSAGRLLDKRRKLTPETRSIFQNVQDELLALRDADTAIVREGVVDRSNRYWQRLWRNQFTVKVMSGEVAELKLRCGKGYVFFRFDPDLSYTAPNSDKTCGLEVVGNPGSELIITQF